MGQKPLKIAVCGASGRTGSRVAALAAADSRFHLTARVDRALAADFEEIARQADAIIDFTSPVSCVHFAAVCAQLGKPFVTGTTGLSVVQRAQMAAAAKKIPIFSAPNFSRGVALMAHLVAQSAKRLEDYDVAITEIHHKDKKDSPSGTALRLAAAVREGRDNEQNVDTYALRLSGMIGEHTVTFAGLDERLEIKHQAQTRDVFARGALEAALWTIKKKPGLYEMSDFYSSP
jgi:4-hydroxy-tetrahydrodipicolinate reductase